MSQPQPIGILPLPFAAAVHELGTFSWDTRFDVRELEPPANVAPYAAAIEADVLVGGEDVASGRLILLYDPDGNDSWDGTMRCVTFAQADVSPETSNDPLMAEVGWSWLVEALTSHDADFVSESGTVTTTASTSFGAKQHIEPRAEIEIRASWTPLLDAERSLAAHLAAWQDLLRAIAGLPGGDDTVIPLVTRR